MMPTPKQLARERVLHASLRILNGEESPHVVALFDDGVREYLSQDEQEQKQVRLAQIKASRAATCARGIHTVYGFKDGVPTCSDCGATCWAQHRDLL